MLLSKGKRRRAGPDPDQDELAVFMAPVELSQLMAIVEELGPRRVLEWGSGGSTKLLLERCSFIERFVSIEHAPKWHDRVRRVVTDSRLELHLVEPDEPLRANEPSEEDRVAWSRSAEREPALLKSYVDLPKSLGTRFDFVLVDGRARCFCLEVGYQLLEAGGGLVIHDAQRARYRDAIDSLGGRATFFTPYERGQLCLIRRPEGPAQR